MGKRTKKKGFLSGILNFFRRNPKIASSEEEQEIVTPDTFERELEKAKIKFENFHLTKNMAVGSEIRKKDYSVKRTSDTIYRLEGKDFQVILVTGNSLGKKDGKTTGILNISDADLNRALQREHSDLGSFLDLWKIELDSSNLEPEPNDYDWRRVLRWEVFWKQQLLIRLRPDTIALLLVSLDIEFRNLVMNTATKKQKKIYHDEIFYLNQGKNSLDWNPYTKNKSLVDPDLAMNEFIKTIRLIEEKREREVGI